MTARICFAAIVIIGVFGCAANPAPESASHPSPANAAWVDPVDILARIHGQAQTLGTESIDVVPLRDAEREHWLQQLRERAQSNDIDGARNTVASALSVNPDDPELLQEAAELALLARDWEQAIALAGKSYELGPRLGLLCRRNWLTVAAARDALADHERSQTARERLAICSPPPPVRM